MTPDALQASEIDRFVNGAGTRALFAAPVAQEVAQQQPGAVRFDPAAAAEAMQRIIEQAKQPAEPLVTSAETKPESDTDAPARPRRWMRRLPRSTGWSAPEIEQHLIASGWKPRSPSKRNPKAPASVGNNPSPDPQDVAAIGADFRGLPAGREGRHQAAARAGEA